MKSLHKIYLTMPRVLLQLLAALSTLGLGFSAECVGFSRVACVWARAYWPAATAADMHRFDTQRALVNDEDVWRIMNGATIGSLAFLTPETHTRCAPSFRFVLFKIGLFHCCPGYNTNHMFLQPRPRTAECPISSLQKTMGGYTLVYNCGRRKLMARRT